MAQDFNVIDFLNPLTLPGRAVKGAGIVAGGITDTAARGVAVATEPLASAAGDVAGFMSVAVREAGETIRDTSRKVLIGEIIVVGGIVATAAIAAWYFSRSPEARSNTWSALGTGTKLLLTKGRG